jgi:HD-GYP domain-containing protein (c-di-GMP phosphodiesterase class II)
MRNPAQRASASYSQGVPSQTLASETLVVATQYTKQIAIDDLVVGMYIVGLDQSWLQSPFLLHRRRIGRDEEIARLKAYGVRRVTIDPTRGLDLVEKLPRLEEGSGEEGRGDGPSPSLGDTLTPTLSQKEKERDSTYQRTCDRRLVSPMPDLALVRAVHTEATTAVQSLFEGTKTGAPLNSAAAQEVVHHLMETVLSQHEALAGLIHMRQFEANLYAHVINVCIFALMLGAMQDLDKAVLTCLGAGALLHDLGQVHLPRNLVRKPGLYTAQEQRLMQAHPHLGALVLSQTPHMPEDTCRIVAEHHERLDGSGYPQGLGGAALSPLSQIVAIADVYETMLGTRQGRPPLLPAQAMKELYHQGRAQQLDLGLVEKMVRCLGIYPVGSLIELNTGERGIVIAVNPGKALQPMVHLLWDQSHQLYATPVTVDLAAPDADAPLRTIRDVLDPVAEGYDLAAYFSESTGT